MSKYADSTEDHTAQAAVGAALQMDYPDTWQNLHFDVVPAFLEPSEAWIEEAKNAGGALFAKDTKSYKYELIMSATGPSLLIFGVQRAWKVDIYIRRFPIGKWPVFLVQKYFEGREKLNDRMPKSMIAYEHAQYDIIKEALSQCQEWGTTWYQEREAPWFAASINEYKAKKAEHTVQQDQVKAGVAAISGHFAQAKVSPFNKKFVSDTTRAVVAAKFPTLQAEKKAAVLVNKPKVLHVIDEEAEEETQELMEVSFGNEYEPPKRSVKRRVIEDE